MDKSIKNAWEEYRKAARQRFWNTIKNFEKRYNLPKLNGQDTFAARVLRHQKFQQIKNNQEVREEFLDKMCKLQNIDEVFDVCDKN